MSDYSRQIDDILNAFYHEARIMGYDTVSANSAAHEAKAALQSLIAKAEEQAMLRQRHYDQKLIAKAEVAGRIDELERTRYDSANLSLMGKTEWATFERRLFERITRLELRGDDRG